MLKLEKVFSLEEDVLPVLPPFIMSVSQRNSTEGFHELIPAAESLPETTTFENLSSPPRGGTIPNYREPHRRHVARRAEICKRNLKLIGQEKGDTILYCYDGFVDDVDTEKRTFIDSMDLKTRKRTLLYTHTATMNVIHATINQDKNLLVFTTYTPYRPSSTPGQETDEVYESCMAEILPQSRVFTLGTPGRKYQRVQFLDYNIQGSAKKQKAVYYLLFILHKEYVHVYSLPMAIPKTPNGGSELRITEQPRKEHAVTKRFVWYQWDMHSQTLHYVYFRPSPREYESRVEYMLRAVNFAEDGKPEIQLDIPINIRLKRNPADDSEYIHLPGSRSVPDANFHMENVKVDTHTSCTCFQGVDEVSQSLIISIIVTQPKVIKRDYVVPMNNFSLEVVQSTRAYFTSLDGMLVIFIPGHYLQFVDCSSDHDACPGLFVPELSPPLPFVDPAVIPNPFITNFETYPNDNQLNAFALYDCQHDIAYIYSVNEEALARVFDRPSLESHIQVFHYAICHKQDDNVVTMLTKHVCQKQPQYATSELFKEILIGMSFQAMKFLRCDSHILRCFPVTTIAPFPETYLEDGKPKITRQPSFVDEFWKPQVSLSKVSSSRFNFEIPATQAALPISPGTPNSKKRLDSFLGRFFSPSGSESPSPKRSMNEEEDESYQQRQKFIDALGEFILQNFPKETRAKAFEWSEKYAARLASQASLLWTSIDVAKRVVINANRGDKKAVADPTFLSLFRLLEHYYSAIEELNFPFPIGFHTKFAVLGFHCLPRHVFVQYVERGVFQMTESFMGHVEHIVGASSSPSDAHLKFLMASRMRGRRKALHLLRKFKENSALVSEQIVARTQNEDDSEDEEEDSENQAAPLNVPDDHEEAIEGEEPIVPNNFLPFVYYVQYLKTKGIKPTDNDYIRRSHSNHFGDL